jgi:branched-chain amino acid transport system permease protein
MIRPGALSLPLRDARRADAIGLLLLAVVGFGVVPLFAHEYLFDAILTPFLALSLVALGLNILTGYAGQLSLGSSAFMAVGAYAFYNLLLRLPGLPLLLDLILAGTMTAVIGLLFGLPSLRVRGFYLAVATLAAQFAVPWALNNFSWFSNNTLSGVISAPPLHIGPLHFSGSRGRYLFALCVTIAMTSLAWRFVSTTTGRNLIALRDNEVAAKVIGVPVLRSKMIAFSVSSFIIGIGGCVWAFAYLRTIEPDGFDLDRSFQILFIIIIGGLASLRGAFLGAAFMVALPLLLSRVSHAVLGSDLNSGTLEMLQHMLIGALIVVILIVEPDGLNAMLRRRVPAGKRLAA